MKVPQVPYTAPVFVSARFKDKEDNEPPLISQVQKNVKK